MPISDKYEQMSIKEASSLEDIWIMAKYCANTALSVCGMALQNGGQYFHLNIEKSNISFYYDVKYNLSSVFWQQIIHPFRSKNTEFSLKKEILERAEIATIPFYKST